MGRVWNYLLLGSVTQAFWGELVTGAGGLFPVAESNACVAPRWVLGNVVQAVGVMLLTGMPTIRGSTNRVARFLTPTALRDIKDHLSESPSETITRKTKTSTITTMIEAGSTLGSSHETCNNPPDT